MSTRELSSADRDAWAARLFDQAVATEQARRFTASLGHPPVEIKRRVGGVTVGDDEEYAEPEPEVEVIPRREWEGPLPRSAASIQKKAESQGYATRAFFHHAERRGAHGRLLDPPEADYCTLAIVRGDVRVAIIWAKVGEKWKFDTALDFTFDEGKVTRPAIVNLATVRKERLE